MPFLQQVKKNISQGQTLGKVPCRIESKELVTEPFARWNVEVSIREEEASGKAIFMAMQNANGHEELGILSPKESEGIFHSKPPSQYSKELARLITKNCCRH